MTRMLPCVGGPLDGLRRELAFTEFSYFAMTSGPPQPVDPMPPFPSVENMHRTVSMMTVRTVYTLRVLSFPGTNIEYLAPEDWTDAQAIEHLLELPR